MSARPITRRSLLAASAGVIASRLLRPRAALALLGGPPAPTLAQRWLGVLTPEGATIELERPADLVGLEWQGPAQAGVWLRFRGRDGRWSNWVSAAANGHGPEARPTADRQVGEPIWTAGITSLQVRASRTLSGVQLHLVNVTGSTEPTGRVSTPGPLALAAGLALATPALAAGPGQPPIIARPGWAQGRAAPRVAPAYGAVRMAFVHHTENPNGYAASEVPAMLRAIYVFHRYVNGWNDIGYNFVIDLYGRIFEARAGGIDEPVVGAHAGGYNLVSTGVAVLGTFTAAPISKAARGALEALLAWKLSLHGVPAQGSVTVRVNPAGASYSRFPANARVPLPRIAGHRDGDATECPGNVLYSELPTIRNGVRGLAPNPTIATLALTAPPEVPSAQSTPEPAGATGTGSPTTGRSQRLSGALALLDGTPLTGAPVIVQQRKVSHRGEVVSERTLAQTTTDSSGKWELDATPASTGGGMSLRALCSGGPGYGAGVSEPLRVPASVSLTAPTANPTNQPTGQMSA
jgi:N-acetylmuramoyl-L-alanine amidase